MGAVSAAADVVSDVVGGAVDAVGDVVGGVADTVGDVVGGAVDAVSSVASSIDDFVTDNIPGGWTLPLVIGAAYATGGASLAADVAAAGEAEGVAGALEAAGGSSALGVSEEALAAANASADPIATLNAEMGWTASDPAYLASLGAPTGSSNVLSGKDYSTVPTEGSVGTQVTAPAGTPVGPPVGTEAQLPPVVDMSTVDPTGVLPGGSGLAGAVAGGLAGAAVGSVIEGALTPDLPGAGPAVATKTYTPDFSMKFAPHTEWKDAPTFDFQFSDVPTDYLTSTQMTPGDTQMIGPGNQAYNSQMIQALRGASAGKASDNTGFTLFQAAK